MRQSIFTAIVGTILLGAVAGQAHAQWRDDQYRDDRYRDYGRDRYGRGGYGYGYGQSGNVVGRVMRDLNMASRSAYVDGHERRHFERAMSELSRFEERWQRGQWDNGRLDRAIEDLSHLADARQLDPRYRRLMAEDANLLRQFRSSRGNYNRGGYSPYGNNGPYGPYTR